MTLSPARAAHLDTCLLLVLLIVFSLLMTDARPLNIPDEGRYPEVAREMLLSGDFITPRNNGVVFLDKPVLYYWLQALSFALFGVETWTARLFPALSSVLGVFMVFIATRRLYSRRAAWLAAMVLACQPLWYLSSQYADMNMKVGVWIVVSLLAFLLADHETGTLRGRWLLLAYAAAGAAILTKGLIGMVLPGLVAGAWVLLRGRWRDLGNYGLAWGIPLIIAINLPWYAMVQRANPDFLHYFFVYQQLERYAASGFNNAQPWWYYLAILGGGLLPWTFLLPGASRHLWRRWRQEGDDGRRHLLLLLWPWLILLFFTLPESKISSYLLPAIPPLAIALGVHMDNLLKRQQAPSSAAVLAGWTPVAVGTAFLVGLAFWKGSEAGRWLLLVTGLQWWLAGSLALVLLARRRLLAAWRVTAASTALGLMLCIPLVPEFTQYSSSRPLADRMRPLVDDETLIIGYRNYLNDLPLYLQQRQPVIVVDDWRNPALMARDNWRREFYIGLQQDASARRWLALEEELPSLLRSGKPFFLIVRRSELAHIQQRHPGLQLWGEFDRVFLFSNLLPPELLSRRGQMPSDG